MYYLCHFMNKNVQSEYVVILSSGESIDEYTKPGYECVNRFLLEGERNMVDLYPVNTILIPE